MKVRAFHLIILFSPLQTTFSLLESTNSIFLPEKNSEDSLIYKTQRLAETIFYCFAIPIAALSSIVFYFIGLVITIFFFCITISFSTFVVDKIKKNRQK